MKTSTVSALALCVVAGGSKLSTEYKAERGLRVEVETTVRMETTSMSMERDGEPVESPGGGGGAASELSRKEVHVDQVVEVDKGSPTKIRRTFEDLGGTSTRTMRDNTSENEITSPMKGVVLEIRRNAEGAVEVTVAEGSKPDDEKALEGHLPELFLDGILPDGDVEVDATWDLDKDAIRRALRLDVERALFPPPQREGDGQAGGSGGGGGGRGGFRGMGGNDVAMLASADWKGKAKLVALDKDVDGKTCAVVEIEIEAAGDLPEQERPAGDRRQRDDMPAIAGAVSPAARAAKSTYEIKLEGKLYFATKEHHPVSLDLEGTVKTESDREFKRQEVTTRVRSVREGTITYKVAVEAATSK